MVANASLNRSYDAEGLRGLLERLESAIADLEAQNEAGEDTAVAHLPEELADKEVLREQVRQAMDDLTSQKRHKRINLTDPDARLMKGRQGIVAGYNAQAMVSPTETDGGATGMLVTAVDVVDAANDNALLVPMVEQAEETTGTRAQMTLADAGYFAASHLEECTRRGQQVVVSESRQRFLKDPYHKDQFTYDFTCPQGPTTIRRATRFTGTDAQVRSYTARERSPVATVPGFRRRLSGMPSLQNLYQGQGDWAKLRDALNNRLQAGPS